eukprot:UN00764
MDNVVNKNDINEVMDHIYQADISKLLQDGYYKNVPSNDKIESFRNEGQPYNMQGNSQLCEFSSSSSSSIFNYKICTDSKLPSTPPVPSAPPEESISIAECSSVSQSKNEYFVGQKIMVKVSNVCKASATVIFVSDITKYIRVRYDMYKTISNGDEEVLHIVNDTHRISINKPIINMVSNEKSMKNECVVCFDGDQDHICMPCGHLCLCKNCKNCVKDVCPICRAMCTVIQRFK